MNIRRPLVLGIVRHYKVEKIAPFVLSLRRSGYTGDIVFFVDDIPLETIEFFDQQGVNMQSLPPRYFVQTRRYLLRVAALLAPAKDRQRAKIELSRYYLHLNDARWPCYYEFLIRTRGLYSHVLFSDIKDVVFQKSPFDFDWKAPICSSIQAPDVLIRDEEKTRGWITEGFGEAESRRLDEKLVSCSGVTFAEIDAGIEYVRLMCEHFVRVNARGLIDQGVHNYLLYHDLAKSNYLYPYGETPVMHLGNLPKDQLKVNDKGMVLNGSGAVVHAVHQYAEHRAAMQPNFDLITKL